MKIIFNVPGNMSMKDAKAFSLRIKSMYAVKILGNMTTGTNEPTVYGMTAEGSTAAVEQFIEFELEHTNWLRIS